MLNLGCPSFKNLFHHVYKGLKSLRQLAFVEISQSRNQMKVASYYSFVPKNRARLLKFYFRANFTAKINPL